MAVIDVLIDLGASNNAGAGQPLWLTTNQSHLMSLSAEHQIWNQVTQTLETIAPGVNCNTTQYGLNTASHGPEVNMAYQWNQVSSADIIVFKHSVIGTLGNDRIPGLPIWNKAANEIWPTMIAQLQAMELQMAGAGDTPNYAGLHWIHGSSDIGPKNRTNYYAHLLQLMIDLRADIGVPNLPIHISRLHDDYDPVHQLNANVIRAAQWKVVNDLADANITLIDTDAFTVGGDNTHFDDAGIHAFGNQLYVQTTLDDPGVGSATEQTDIPYLFPATVTDDLI